MNSTDSFLCAQHQCMRVRAHRQRGAAGADSLGSEAALRRRACGEGDDGVAGVGVAPDAVPDVHLDTET